MQSRLRRLPKFAWPMGAHVLVVLQRLPSCFPLFSFIKPFNIGPYIVFLACSLVFLDFPLVFALFPHVFTQHIYYIAMHFSATASVLFARNSSLFSPIFIFSNNKYSRCYPVFLAFFTSFPLLKQNTLSCPAFFCIFYQFSSAFQWFTQCFHYMGILPFLVTFPSFFPGFLPFSHGFYNVSFGSYFPRFTQFSCIFQWF